MSCFCCFLMFNDLRRRSFLVLSILLEFVTIIHCFHQQHLNRDKTIVSNQQAYVKDPYISLNNNRKEINSIFKALQ
jgi:hypothetical protein